MWYLTKIVERISYIEATRLYMNCEEKSAYNLRIILLYNLFIVYINSPLLYQQLGVHYHLENC